MTDLFTYLKGNRYPGRGILVGLSKDGEKAVVAYFIMGRSENSRNRVFSWENGVLYTRAHDIQKVTDPSLILYPAFRTYQNRAVVTNGTQTDLIYDSFEKGESFADALAKQTFEPDFPNCTPRIGAVLTYGIDFSYQMGIVKKAEGEGKQTNRYLFNYEAVPGTGHIIHTYQGDGDPLPSFSGEPVSVAVPNDVETFAEKMWDALDAKNKISLFVRTYSLPFWEAKNILFNKNNRGRL